jgi:Lrp/AsnC family transcriptional regulator, regulator for asnA, asnC and gidA
MGRAAGGRPAHLPPRSLRCVPASFCDTEDGAPLPNPTDSTPRGLTSRFAGCRNRSSIGVGEGRGVWVPFSLDTIDRKIVSLLLEDGRISSAEITRRIGHVSERAVRYRIERLIRSGVIRISAIVNPQAVGFSIIGDVLVDVAPGRLQDVAAQLVEFDTVSYVAGSVGEGDLSLQVYARDTGELLRFVNEVIGKIPGVTRTKTYMVPWKLKDVYEWHVPVEAAEEGRATG